LAWLSPANAAFRLSSVLDPLRFAILSSSKMRGGYWEGGGEPSSSLEYF
jgi:hypothetical protein